VADRLGTTWNRPNTAPSSPAEASDFIIQDRAGPLVMTASLVERFVPGSDTMVVTFSEAVVQASLAGVSLSLIKNGAETDLTVAVLTAIDAQSYRIVVTGTAAPAVGDSLRIKVGGPLTDTSAWKNAAHASNRPVVITIKKKPTPVTSAAYFDRNADGEIDYVVLHFAKGVVLSDCIVKIDRGGANKVDSVAVSRLGYVSGDTIVEANIAGLFPGITAPLTSGAMVSTVGYRSIPGETVQHDVADSAAPVLADTAYFYPGKTISATTSEADTLVVTFSEPINSAIDGTTPFKFHCMSLSAPYTLPLNTTSFTPRGGNSYQFITTGKVIPEDPIKFPRTGDSVWIDPAASIKDVSLNVQKNPANRRVPLKVTLKPDLRISISSNPFNPADPILVRGVSGSGLAITIRPEGQMGDLSNVREATVTIYDVLGNTVIEKTPFKKNVTENIYYFTWDGHNKNNRMVGTGTYLAVIMTTDQNGKRTKELQRIGVKR
jgi:hypothetical protein